MFITPNWNDLKEQLAHPGIYRDLIVKYLVAAGYPITASKSISEKSVIHQQAVVSKTLQAYFTTGATTTNSNSLNSNFAFPTGEHFLLTHIKALEGANATVDATAWVEGIATADVINGYWTLSTNGQVQMRNMPLTVFTEADEFPGSGVFRLPIPIIIGGNETYELDAQWRTAPATANQNLRFELFGLGLNS